MTDMPCYTGDKKYSAEMCKVFVKNTTDSISLMNKNFMGYFKKVLQDAKFDDFYNAVLKDSHKIPDQYKMKCTLVDLEKETMKKSIRNIDACRDFLVCSEELKEFLTVFYHSLNDTAVRAFRNYAAMYERDIVADESEEKNAVIATINRASNIIKDRVSNVFISTTGQITLDENKDKEMNIAALRDYVKHTIETVNRTVNKHLETDISALRVRVLLAVKQDLAHNLATDLRYFENDDVKQICSFFVTCKGLPKLTGSQYLFRKQLSVPSTKLNSVFVKMELALDDDLKNTLMKNHKPMLQTFRSDKVTMRGQNDLNNSNIVVTRTTMRTDENPTTIIETPILMERSDSHEHDEEIDAGSLEMSRK